MKKILGLVEVQTKIASDVRKPATVTLSIWDVDANETIAYAEFTTEQWWRLVGTGLGLRHEVEFTEHPERIGKVMETRQLDIPKSVASSLDDKELADEWAAKVADRGFSSFPNRPDSWRTYPTRSSTGLGWGATFEFWTEQEA